MEDMARLALVEQSVKDVEKLSKILYELLRYIQNILENPHDPDLRTIKSNIIKDAEKFESFMDYMKYVGFQSKDDMYIYPNELTLNSLRLAQVAIQRKIAFCCGAFHESCLRMKSSQGLLLTKKNDLKPSNILTTRNPLLLKIEHLFNNMLVYEDEELQALAREHIPIVTLQLLALDRVREQQRKLKTGEIKGHDLPFDMALLMELLGWFKHKFFTWVDKPACELCGGPTVFSEKMVTTLDREICDVEVYKCVSCSGRARFPRHNSPRALLRTRRGRCGEWANCFTLLCRALGYDTRFVYDTTDHVWCEVFDYDSRAWVHADPCEATFNAPLSYEHGWGKKLAYVIAVSRDDLQDVTWRYTLDHKEVLKRRTACNEAALVSAILSLRSHRHAQLAEARRRYLSRRNVEELVQLMVERTPTDYECHGRISGSREWRTTRGEIGTSGHVFEITDVGRHSLAYHPVSDTYRHVVDGREANTIHTWSSGTFHAKSIFRKIEQDWRKVYLARLEDEPTGSISWKLSAAPELQMTDLTVRALTALYEDAAIAWTVSFDDQPPRPVTFGVSAKRFEDRFSSVEISGVLSGGRGHLAWQHAQLFRLGLDEGHSAFEIDVTAHKK